MKDVPLRVAFGTLITLLIRKGTITHEDKAYIIDALEYFASEPGRGTTQTSHDSYEHLIAFLTGTKD